MVIDFPFIHLLSTAGRSIGKKLAFFEHPTFLEAFEALHHDPLPIIPILWIQYSGMRR